MFWRFHVFRSLLATSVLAYGTLEASEAAASDDEKPATATTSLADDRAFRANLRQLALTGHGAAVRAAVIERLGQDHSAVASAGLLEILAVADAWSGRGSPPSIDAEESEAPDDWSAALDVVRSEIVRGAYRAALARVERLRGSAPDLASAARALELRALASDGLRAHAPPGAVEEPKAVAAPSQRAPSIEPHAESHWYGWETLITDGAALATTPFFPVGGLGTYLAGGPVVHLANGRPGIAAASLGLRVGAPLAGALTGVALWRVTCGCGGNTRGDFGNLEPAVYGLVGGSLGVIAAVVIDSALLAREKVLVEEHPNVASLRPSATPRREGGFDVGVVGTW